LLLCIYSIPGEPYTCTSTGVATVCSTVNASAPVNCPDICTIGGVISGYCPTGRLKMQIVPTSTNTTDITIAVTGLFKNVLAIIQFLVLNSFKFYYLPEAALPSCGAAVLPVLIGDPSCSF